MLLHQLHRIDLGRLDHLHLADQRVLQRIDLVALLLNASTDRLHAQLRNQRRQIALRHLLRDDLHHLRTNAVDLRGLRVASLLVLVVLLAGERDAEQTQLVTVRGRHLHVALDQSLPLLDQRTQLVAGDVHSVEESDALVSLHILHSQLDLAVTLLLVLAQITQIGLENTSLQTLGGDFQSRSTRHERLAHITHQELVRGTHIVPLLLSHGIDHLLSLTLLTDFLLRLAYNSVRAIKRVIDKQEEIDENYLPIAIIHTTKRVEYEESSNTTTCLIIYTLLYT